MNQSLIEKIAAAVLYEGYILYPYRPALKNIQRWTFGGVVPRAYSEAVRGSDAWTMQTECLVEAKPEALLDVRVRFLHLVARTVGKLTAPLAEWPAKREPEIKMVEALDVGGQSFQGWQEAVEREVSLDLRPISQLAAMPRRHSIASPACRRLEGLRCPEADEIVGVLIREQQPIDAVVDVRAEAVGEELFKVTVKVLNETHLDDPQERSRDEALMRSLVSTHAILNVRGGAFVSLIDPPEQLREVASGCNNVGAWPVLVGEEGERDTMLAAPIILYDYPQVAPESPGDLFDSTEIDELLTLRILTLTGDEKQQMASVEQQTRALLARTEALGSEDLWKLHGTFRGRTGPSGGDR
jgi:hypothetical protein